LNAPKWNPAKNGPNRNLVRGALLAIAVVLLGILVYRQMQRSHGVTVKVPVATQDLEAGAVVEPEKLGEAGFPIEELSTNTVRNPASIEGRTLAKAKAAGVPFLRGDLAPPAGSPGLAGILPEGRLLMFVPVTGMPMNDIAAELRFGDRFDLLALRGRRPALEELAFSSQAWTVARDVYYLGWVSPRPPGGGQQGSDEDSQEEGIGRLLTSAAEAQAAANSGGGGGMSALLLGIHPEDVLPLAEAQAVGAPMALVLHGRKEVEAGELLVLPRPRLNEVELILGGNRTRIPLRRPRQR